MQAFQYVDLEGMATANFTHEVLLMSKMAIGLTKEPIIGNAGLLAVGELLRISGIDEVCSHRESANHLVAEKDILRCLCGLISIGKTGFDHIRPFKEDEYFVKTLGISRMPSEATLRQRFEAMSLDRKVHDALPGCTVRMLKKVDFKPQIISVPGFVGVRIDTDPTILDNSDTKKEGVAKVYNGVSGYAPVCSFLAGGLILGAELRPGNQHALHEGALAYHEGVRQRVRKVVKNARLLWVDDAAFDDASLMASRREAGDSFIIRHNLRREKPEILIKLAMEEGRPHSARPGKTVFTGSTIRELKGVGKVRLVYEVTERTSKKGQTLLLPEYKVFSVWTSLEEVSEANVLRLYRDRGTCEQFFAELKSELDLERLPSGKFSVNELYFQLGVQVNNMLRVIGESLLEAGIIGLKQATRRRLRTIMQGMMYLCGRLVRHARRLMVKVVSRGGFGEALVGLYQRLAAV